MYSSKCFAEFPFRRGCLNEHWDEITNEAGQCKISEEHSHFFINLLLRFKSVRFFIFFGYAGSCLF